MSISAARYVRLNDRENDLAKLARLVGGAAIHVDVASTFALVAIATPMLGPDDLTELSRTFGEALSLQTQSIADLVIYDHYRAGARARGFTQAGEAGWVRVVGEPEPWERGFFFGAESLAAELAELEDDVDDATLLARETGEVQRLWSGARLVEGATRPRADGHAITRAITREYGLPVHAAAPSSKRLISP